MTLPLSTSSLLSAPSSKTFAITSEGFGPLLFSPLGI